MSMQELQGAIGGPPGGAPPSITIPGDPSGGAPGPQDQGPSPDQGGSSIDFLDAAEEALQQFIQVDPDETDRAEATKALQIVIKLKASNQTDQQSGGLKSLARALQGGGGGAPGGPVGP